MSGMTKEQFQIIDELVKTRELMKLARIISLGHINSGSPDYQYLDYLAMKKLVKFDYSIDRCEVTDLGRLMFQLWAGVDNHTEALAVYHKLQVEEIKHETRISLAIRHYGQYMLPLSTNVVDQRCAMDNVRVPYNYVTLSRSEYNQLMLSDTARIISEFPLAPGKSGYFFDPIFFDPMGITPTPEFLLNSQEISWETAVDELISMRTDITDPKVYNTIDLLHLMGLMEAFFHLILEHKTFERNYGGARRALDKLGLMSLTECHPSLFAANVFKAIFGANSYRDAKHRAVKFRYEKIPFEFRYLIAVHARHFGNFEGIHWDEALVEAMNYARVPNHWCAVSRREYEILLQHADRKALEVAFPLVDDGCGYYFYNPEKK